MLNEIIQGIEEMEYPKEKITKGLNDEGIAERSGAAAYGFAEAQERIVEIIRRHSNKRSVGDDYKNRIMERFMKTE